jgi:hypothetical protein
MTDAVRAALKGQYHASLEMLRQTVEQFPDQAWTAREHRNAPWQIAYHALYFTHMYLMPDEAAFRPWAGEQSQVQNPDGIGGSPDPKNALPDIPDPYTRAQVLTYLTVCDGMVDDAVDALDLDSPESGFSWYKVPKLEHQLISLRHLQHHTGQLQDRLRAAADIGVRWVGSRRAAAR